MSSTRIRGEALAGGVAEGRLVSFSVRYPAASGPRLADDAAAEGEVERFRRHAASLAADLGAEVERLGTEGRSVEAEVLGVHLALLKDPEFQRLFAKEIRRFRLPADAAVERAVDGVVALFEGSANALMAERESDARDLARRLRQSLAHEAPQVAGGIPREEGEVVLVTEHLLPSLVLTAKERGVAAFVVERGTSISHAAILARSLGLPVVRLSRLDVLRLASGADAVVDGIRGEVVVEPSRMELGRRREIAHAAKPAPPTVARLWLSILGPEGLAGADWDLLSGVGLFRTEALYLRKPDAFPSEEELLETFRRVFRGCPDRPVVVRTPDIGGDKPLRHLRLGPNENPYLGLRAHRIYRYHPEILVTFLRALLRAGTEAKDLRILHPMVESVEDWHFVQSLFDRAVAELRDAGETFRERVRQGLLVETPSALLDFPRLAKLVDFASVGTNDLVQYLFAVDRGNANVASSYRPEHPVLLRALRSLAGQARAAEIELSICGEIAGDPAFLPLLVGLGLVNLSVSPTAVPAVLRRMSGSSPVRCHELADRCLAAETSARVRDLLGIGSADAKPDVDVRERDEVVDPVCGMVVDPAESSWEASRNGETRHFCSRACRDAWRIGA